MKYLWSLTKEVDMNTQQILDMDDTYVCVRIRMEHVEQQSSRTEQLADRLHSCVNTLGENIEWQSDYTTICTMVLTPDRNRRTYTLEQGNIVARHVMGAERYLTLVRQQNHGIDLTADTHGEQAEEEHMEVDDCRDDSSAHSQTLCQ